MVVIGGGDPVLDALLAGMGLARVVEIDGNVIWGPPPVAPTAVVAAPVQPGPTRQLLTIPEAADALSIGRSSVYELIGHGDLQVVHVGRSARVPAAEVDRLVTRLATG